MKKHYWEITVWWEEPRTFYLDHDTYPMQVVIEMAQILMDKYGAIDYSVKNVWEEL